MAFNYTDKVMDNFLHPKNIGEMEHPDSTVTEGNPTCGDQIQLQIKVNEKTKIIEDIKFKSYGCASNIATASVMTELAKGKTIEEAKKITWQTIKDELVDLPPVKIHCSILAVETLQKAIEEYESNLKS